MIKPSYDPNSPHHSPSASDVGPASHLFPAPTSQSIPAAIRLQGRNVIDTPHVGVEGKDGFPACDRFGADHGVDSGEVLRRRCRVGPVGWDGVEFEVATLDGLVESRLRVGGVRVLRNT